MVQISPSFSVALNIWHIIRFMYTTASEWDTWLQYPPSDVIMRHSQGIIVEAYPLGGAQGLKITLLKVSRSQLS